MGGWVGKLAAAAPLDTQPTCPGRAGPPTPPATPPALPSSPPPPPTPTPPPPTQIVLPPTVPATLAYMHEGGAYLISNGTLLVLWLGRGADPGLVSQASLGGFKDLEAGGLRPGGGRRGRGVACLAVPHADVGSEGCAARPSKRSTDAAAPPAHSQLLGPEAASPNADVSALPLEPPRQGSPLSQRLCALLRELRRGRPQEQPAFAVRQGTPAEAVAMPLLVEDRTAGQPSYADFLVALLKQVLAK
jgi:hypothetical protein